MFILPPFYCASHDIPMLYSCAVLFTGTIGPVAIALRSLLHHDLQHGPLLEEPSDE